MKILALDYGTHRVGVALGDAELGIAFPQSSLLGDATLLPALDALIAQHGVVRVLVGLPRQLDGTDSDTTAATRSFAQQLRERQPQLKLEFIDERFSTATVAQSAQRLGHSAQQQRGERDSAAAAMLLQGYFDKR